MLGTRILTAAIALPLAVAAILFLSTPALALIVAALMLMGAWEWAGLVGLVGNKRLWLVAVTAVVIGLSFLLSGAHGLSIWNPVLLAAALFWLAVVFWILRFPQFWAVSLGRRPPALAIGVITLTAPVLTVADIRALEQGPSLLLLLCLMIWGADTGAYTAGRILGRQKLMPRVSPGKTVEGALGGLAVAMLIGALGALVLGYDGSRTLRLTLLGGWIAAISIVGDLTVSMFKRSAGMKDSGRLFPGHGGVLDRLDSLLAAAPWFVIGLQIVLWAP